MNKDSIFYTFKEGTDLQTGIDRSETEWKYHVLKLDDEGLGYRMSLCGHGHKKKYFQSWTNMNECKLMPLFTNGYCSKCIDKLQEMLDSDEI